MGMKPQKGSSVTGFSMDFQKMESQEMFAIDEDERTY